MEGEITWWLFGEPWLLRVRADTLFVRETAVTVLSSSMTGQKDFPSCKLCSSSCNPFSSGEAILPDAWEALEMPVN